MRRYAYFVAVDASFGEPRHRGGPPTITVPREGEGLRLDTVVTAGPIRFVNSVTPPTPVPDQLEKPDQPDTPGGQTLGKPSTPSTPGTPTVRTGAAVTAVALASAVLLPAGIAVVLARQRLA